MAGVRSVGNADASDALLRGSDGLADECGMRWFAGRVRQVISIAGA
jgi:hypothetical protein